MSSRSSSNDGLIDRFMRRTSEEAAAIRARADEAKRRIFEGGEDLVDQAARGLRSMADAQLTAAQLQTAQAARAGRAVVQGVARAISPPKAKDIGVRGPQSVEPVRVAGQGRYLVDLTKPEALPFMTTYAWDKDGNIDPTRSYINEYPASGLGTRTSYAELRGQLLDMLAGEPVDRGPHVTFVNDKPKNPSPYQPLTTSTARMAAAGIVDSGFDSVNINSTTGGKHSDKSLHYRGQAVDMNRINGRRVDDPRARADAEHLQDTFRRQENIVQNYGPTYLENSDGGSAIRFVNPGLSYDHRHHVHVGGRR